jgi:hypothetical protein
MYLLRHRLGTLAPNTSMSAHSIGRYTEGSSIRCDSRAGSA